MKQEGQFSKNNNLLQYAIQLVCVLKWNKRDSFQKKTTIYYSMLFNLCAYWNETRGAVFKKIQLWQYATTCVRNETRGAVFKKQQFITVCYSTCVRIEMKQEGQFSKNNNLLQYAIQLVCVLKWNKRDSFQKKNKFITVCYSTCVHIEMKQEDSFQKNPINDNMLLLVCEMKQEGQFSKNNNLLQYAIQLVCVLKWNKRGSFQKTTIYYSMLFNLCAYWNETRGTVFKKKQFITVCYSTCVHIEMKQEGQFSKKSN